MKEVAFSLIELLVAVTIFATTSVVMYSSFRAGVVSWRRIDSEVLSQQQIRSILNKIEQDIKCVVYLSNLPFEGSSHRITLTSLVKSPGVKGLGLARVSYHLSYRDREPQSSAIVRTEESLKDAISISETDKIAKKEKTKREDKLLEGVNNLKFSYLSLKRNPADEETERYEWIDEWDKKDVLPLGVAVEFIISGQQGLKETNVKRKVFIPTGTREAQEETSADRNMVSGQREDVI